MKSINHACVSVRAHLYGPEEFLLWSEESWPLEQDEFFLAEEFAGPGKDKNLLFDLLTSHSCLKVQFDDPVRQSANLSEKQKSKYVILTTVTSSSNGDSGSSPDSKTPAPGKLDQVPEPRVTYFRREQVELGYRGPAGPGSGMFNMGNTCYLNSTLQVR